MVSTAIILLLFAAFDNACPAPVIASESKTDRVNGAVDIVVSTTVVLSLAVLVIGCTWWGAICRFASSVRDRFRRRWMSAKAPAYVINGYIVADMIPTNPDFKQPLPKDGFASRDDPLYKTFYGVDLNFTEERKGTRSALQPPKCSKKICYAQLNDALLDAFESAMFDEEALTAPSLCLTHEEEGIGGNYEHLPRLSVKESCTNVLELQAGPVNGMVKSVKKPERGRPVMKKS